MVDWNAVGMAVVRAEGRLFTDIAELALDRKLDWETGPGLVAERAEAVQHSMLDEWEAAGVAYPMTLYGMAAEATGALLLLGMAIMPGRTLRMMTTMYIVGGLYGASQAFSHRRIEDRMADPDHSTPRQPLRPFGEQQGGGPHLVSGS